MKRPFEDIAGLSSSKRDPLTLQRWWRQWVQIPEGGKVFFSFSFFVITLKMNKFQQLKKKKVELRF